MRKTNASSGSFSLKRKVEMKILRFDESADAESSILIMQSMTTCKENHEVQEFTVMNEQCRKYLYTG